MVCDTGGEEGQSRSNNRLEALQCWRIMRGMHLTSVVSSFAGLTTGDSVAQQHCCCLTATRQAAWYQALALVILRPITLLLVLTAAPSRHFLPSAKPWYRLGLHL